MNKLTTLTVLLALLSVVGANANPMPPVLVDSIRAYPPEIHVSGYSYFDLSGLEIVTSAGVAIVDSGVVGDWGVPVVLDSSNTSGFVFDTEADSLFMPDPFWTSINWGYLGMSSPPLQFSITKWFEGIPPWGYNYSFGFIDNVAWGYTEVVINEINPHETWNSNSNFIELYNLSDTSINLGGWLVVCDTIIQLPDNSIIQPFGHFIIDEIEFPSSFDMDYTADNIYLIDANSYIVDQVGWSSDHGENVSFMRFPDGDVDTSYIGFDYIGYDDSSSFTFENGFPTRGAQNRHDSPGFVIIGAHAIVLDIGIDIGWTNPVWDPIFDEVRIVRNVERFPETVDDGVTVYEGNAQEFLDIGAPINSPIHYTIFAKDTNGQYSTPTEESQIYIINGVVGVEDEILPEKIAYLKAYPNPFNNSTVIGFDIYESSHVSLSIYNLLGQRIDVLVNEDLPSGKHNVSWDAYGYSSGIYLAKLEMPAEKKAIKIQLLR